MFSSELIRGLELFSKDKPKMDGPQLRDLIRNPSSGHELRPGDDQRCNNRRFYSRSYLRFNLRFYVRS